ncbi:MAG: V-type ATP synthase subunit E [Planctomycetota bacterium]|jgi:vacuolar-type H+-ATPase subunit E/Vma4
MALDDILATIRREAEEFAARRLADAREEADGIEADARREADELRAGMEARLGAQAGEYRRRQINRARLHHLQAERAAREQVFAQAFAQLSAALENARSREDYARIFAMLLAEADRALPDASIVRIDPRDAGHVDDRTVETTLRSWGGVELAAADGRVVRNTLEERLRRAEPELRRLAANALA